MSRARQLHIADEPTTEYRTRKTTADEVDVFVRQPSQYEAADTISLWSTYDRDPVRFILALADELGKDEIVDDIRRVDSLEVDQTDDVDLAELLIFPDESLLFIGSDPTARDAIPLLGFSIERHQPIPAPESAQEALDLLKPGDVKRAREEGGELPGRQGEWWLLPTRRVPVSTTYRPGVSKRPFGPSPLDNHVPTEYGLAVSEDVFMEQFRDLAPKAPGSIETPPEVFEWVHQQRAFDDRVEPPEHVPEWSDLQDIAGEIFVRGTLRHRENDHYVEQIGEQWHEAQTHNFDVYTGDDYIEEVRID